MGGETDKIIPPVGKDTSTVIGSGLDHHSSPIAGYFLVLSNAAIAPALFVAIKRKLYPEAAVLFTLAMVSSPYHFCQIGAVCVFPFESVQLSDHFFVYSSLLWMSLYFSDTTLEERFCMFFMLQGLLLPSVIRYVSTNSWLLSAVVIGGAAISALFVMGFMHRRAPKFGVADLIASAMFIGVGLFFHIYAGEPGGDNYGWAHSLWHCFVMVAIYFVLESKRKNSWLRRTVKNIIYTDECYY